MRGWDTVIIQPPDAPRIFRKAEGANRVEIC
jgi:hypothetical protein